MSFSPIQPCSRMIPNLLKHHYKVEQRTKFRNDLPKITTLNLRSFVWKSLTENCSLFNLKKVLEQSFFIFEDGSADQSVCKFMVVIFCARVMPCPYTQQFKGELQYKCSPLYVCDKYFFVPRCSIPFWTHPEITPVGPFFRWWIKSINQA